ncbi:hypothetical protein GCM10017714_19080 [Curtobacterium pusillum]|nr:hypothetical protein GCM10017610_33280 [Curtobacterium pusillum]
MGHLSAARLKVHALRANRLPEECAPMQQRRLAHLRSGHHTLPRADSRSGDDAASLEEVRNWLLFAADTSYDLRYNLPS